MTSSNHFRLFIVTSQGERKYRWLKALTTLKIVSPACDDFSYSARNLEVHDSGYGVNSGREDEEYGGGNTYTLGKEPYQFKPTGTDWTTLRLCNLLLLVPKMVLILCNLRWCSFLVDPICIGTHTIEYVLQLAYCGGDCI